MFRYEIDCGCWILNYLRIHNPTFKIQHLHILSILNIHVNHIETCSMFRYDGIDLPFCGIGATPCWAWAYSEALPSRIIGVLSLPFGECGETGMSPDRIPDNRNKVIGTALAKPLDRPKSDHLGGGIIVTNLVDQIHHDPEHMEGIS